MRLLLSSNSLRLLLLAALVAAAGCSRSGGGSYVAKVGSATLTHDDLTHLRPAGADSLLDSRRYINDWVVAELLYHEAERRGISESPEVKAAAEQARRRLAVAALLQQEIYSDTSSISDQAVQAYYAQHAAAFTLPEDVVQISYAAFADRDAANAFRSTLLQGASWVSAVERLQADTTGRSGLLQLADHQFFTRSRLYPQELWKLATTLPRGDVSFALKAGAGFYVLTVHGVQRQGSVPGLDYVRSDVRDRLLLEHRRERYEKLLDQLRLKTDVDVRLGSSGRGTE